MNDFSKVKATCEHCEKEFTLAGVEVKVDDFKNNKLDNPIFESLYFPCTNCGSYNSFTFDDLSLVSD